MNERSDVVERALGYPYAAPLAALRPARPPDPRPGRGRDRPRRARTPVLAYGSNAAPEVLARKLALSDQPVLVVPRSAARLRRRLLGPHLSLRRRAGDPPAQPRHRGPGPRRLHDRASRSALVSATEPNYEPTLLEGVDCRLDDGERADRALGLHQPPRLPARRRLRGRPRRRSQATGRTLRRARASPRCWSSVRALALPGREPRDVRPRPTSPTRPLAGPHRPAAAPVRLPPPAGSDRGEAAQGEAGEQAVGDDQDRRGAAARPPMLGPAGVERRRSSPAAPA